MKLRRDDSVKEDNVLIITPESKEDEDEIAKVSGGFDKDSDTKGYHEAKSFYGLSAYLHEDGKSLVVAISRAWWNYDD